MEQERINIAALLKDCSKGTKLYSPICGECELMIIKETQYAILIVVKDTKDSLFNFDAYGYFTIHGECLLFPSKEVRDWNYYRVKYAKGKNAIKTLIKNGGKNKVGYAEDGISTFYIRATDNNIEPFHFLDQETRDHILSTGTRLKFEEEKPKFKVGDVVVAHNDKSLCIYIKQKYCQRFYEDEGTFHECSMDIDRLATPDEIAKWNEEVLQPNHLHYSTSKRKIIHWLLPFDRVVVRFKCQTWQIDIFSHCGQHANGSDMSYVCIGDIWDECLPYNEETAKLIGTTNNFEED